MLVTKDSYLKSLLPDFRVGQFSSVDYAVDFLVSKVPSFLILSFLKDNFASQLKLVRQALQSAVIPLDIIPFRDLCCRMTEDIGDLFYHQAFDVSVLLFYAVDQVCGEGMSERVQGLWFIDTARDLELLESAP